MSLLLLGVLTLPLAASSLFAQGSPAPPPPANLLGSNGGFERIARTTDNVWDGVDGDGYLAVHTFSPRVLTDSSAMSNLAMPPSVAFVDLNGDGKPDLLVADPVGYFYCYLNRGTPTEPKFTNADVLPLFVSATARPRPNFYSSDPGGFLSDDQRSCPRFSAADWRKRGVFDLLIGNLSGELLFVPNSGTARQPVYAQPFSIDRARVQSNDKNRLWANLLAPAAWDWNGDGRLDLLTGEGTYSANAIHLLENIGGDVPRFTDVKHTRIAYGDGREHLIPTIVDYNGDGNPDLLVADRTGEIGVYLNPGPPKPGIELKRVSNISFGSSSKMPGLVSPCAADFNGDGLFDLIMGMPNGRISVAINTGSKTQPVFGPWQEIKGMDRLPRNVKIPADWELLTDMGYGNALADFAVVNAQDDSNSQPPEGANCLRAGYWSLANALFSFPNEGLPSGGRHFQLVRRNISLDTTKTYHVSFKIKGAGIEKAHYGFFHRFNGYVGPVKIERDDRGAGTRVGDRASEEIKVGADISVGSSWTTVEKSLKVQYNRADLKANKQVSGSFYIDFYARSMSSVIYIDDIRLTE
jgi:hypothetical protein